MSDKISLTNTQLEFLKMMLEIQDSELAVDKFAMILIEERVDPIEMSKIINKIITRMKKV